MVEGKTTTAGPMEASSLWADFAEPPSETAPVEDPKVLKDTTRLALKRKKLEAEDRLAKHRATSNREASGIDKTTIKILPDTEARAARGASPATTFSSSTSCGAAEAEPTTRRPSAGRARGAPAAITPRKRRQWRTMAPNGRQTGRRRLGARGRLPGAPNERTKAIATRV